MTDLNTQIAQKLKELRHKHRLTQSEMAERIGVAMRSYQKYEGGERFPKAQIIERICKEFSLTNAELFSDDSKQSKGEVFTIDEAMAIVKKLSMLEESRRQIIIKQIDIYIEAQSKEKRKAN